MSFLGMGPVEVLVVLLLAFILLGPQRMVDATRLLGKATNELRRMADELPNLTLDEEPKRPIVHREGGPALSVAGSADRPEDADARPADNGPVGFKPPGGDAEIAAEPDGSDKP